MINPALLGHRPSVLHIKEDGETDVDKGDETEKDLKESEYIGMHPIEKCFAEKQPPQQPQKKKKGGCVVNPV